MPLTIFVDKRFVAAAVDALPTVSDTVSFSDFSVTFGRIKKVVVADAVNGPKR